VGCASHAPSEGSKGWALPCTFHLAFWGQGLTDWVAVDGIGSCGN